MMVISQPILNGSLDLIIFSKSLLFERFLVWIEDVVKYPPLDKHFAFDDIFNQDLQFPLIKLHDRTLTLFRGIHDTNEAQKFTMTPPRVYVAGYEDIACIRRTFRPLQQYAHSFLSSNVGLITAVTLTFRRLLYFQFEKKKCSVKLFFFNCTSPLPEKVIFKNQNVLLPLYENNLKENN